MLILCFMVSYGETHSGNAGSMLGKNQKRFIGVFSRMVFRAYPDKRKTYTIPLVGEFLFVSQFPETIIQAPKKSTRVITAGYSTKMRVERQTKDGSVTKNAEVRIYVVSPENSWPVI